VGDAAVCAESAVKSDAGVLASRRFFSVQGL